MINFKLSKNLSAQTLAAIILLVISLLLTGALFVSSNKVDRANAKTTLAQQEADKYKAKSESKSDVELLDEQAQVARLASERKLEEINKLEAAIKTERKLYEEYVLTHRCATNQLKRKAEWLEYNTNYCEDKNNLSQFKTVKH